MTSARNAAAIAKGMDELRPIVFYSREERGRWRQRPRCLRCSKLRRIGGSGGLMMTPRRSSGCGACIPELTTRRDRGRSQAPWTIVMLVRKQPKHPHFEGDIYVSPAVPHAVCLFVASSPCWRHSRSGITICNSSSTEFASTSLYSIYIRSCPQQTVCSTPTHTSTKLNCLQYY